MQPCRNTQDHVDAVTAFLEDAVHVSVVLGKNDYLPLTRRIRLGRLLTTLHAASPQATVHRIVSDLTRTLQKLAGFPALSEVTLDLYALATQVETFLDTPSHSAPAALRPMLKALDTSDQRERERAEGVIWRVYSLLSLLPPEQRVAYPDVLANSDAAAYFRFMQAEAADARRLLVSGSLRLAVNGARDALGDGVPFLDLVQEACLGLVRAAETYDERRGRWDHYAAQWVRQATSRAIADQRSLVRIPVHVQDRIRKSRDFQLWRGEYNLGAGVVRERNEDEGGEVLPDSGSCTVDATLTSRHRRRISTFREFTIPPYSLDSDETGVLGSLTYPCKEDMANLLVDAEDLDTRIDSRVVRDIALYKVFEGVSERERDVLMLRFGLVDGEEHTLEDIGQRFGVTRERIRQIQVRATEKIQRNAQRSSGLATVDSLFTRERVSNVADYASRQEERLVRAMRAYEDRHWPDPGRARSLEMTRIDALIDGYLEGAHSNVGMVRRYSSRATLLRRAL